MSRYLLPITINNRRNLVAPLQNNIPYNLGYFIIETTDSGIRYPLFSVNKKNYIQSLIKGKADISINNINLNISENNGKINVALTKSNTANDATETSDNTKKSNWRFEFNNLFTAEKEETENKKHIETIAVNGVNIITESNTNAFNFFLEPTENWFEQNNINNILSFAVEFNDGEKNYNAELNFSIANQNSIVQLGFDFGSEASQMKQRSFRKIGEIYEEQIKEINLFETVKNYCNEKENSENYFQYEKFSPFLKSVFFCKKTLQQNSDNFDENHLLDNSNEVLILQSIAKTDRNFYENWLQLPNLKITHKYSENLWGYDLIINNGIIDKHTNLSEVKEKIYGSILNEIISAQLKVNNLNKPIDIKFTILIPNIYNTIDIYRTKLTLTEVFEKIKNETQRIKSYEIITLSESDASYMGYYNQGTRFVDNNKYYIIIDCGKGTTDFSIVQSDSNNILEYKNLYRNGFAGAGNLITHAFFESFCHYFILQSENEANAKQLLKNIFEKLQDADKIKLFELFEKYKRNYNEKTSQLSIEQEFAQAQTGDLNFKNLANDLRFVNTEALFNLMNQCTTCFNWNNYIQNTVNAIAENTVNYLKPIINNIDKQITCGGVLLSGRGFLFEPLKNSLVAQLQTIGVNDKLIQIPQTPNDYKNMCLKGVFKSNFIYNPDIMCMPVEVAIKTNKEQTETTVIKEKTKGIFGFFKRQTQEIFGDADFQFNEETNQLNLQEQEFQKLRVIIGNYYYEPAHYNINIEAEKKRDLVFTGKDFVIRCFDTENKVTSIIELKKDVELSNENQDIIIASLFPSALQQTQMNFLKTDYSKLKNIKDEFDDFMPKF